MAETGTEHTPRGSSGLGWCSIAGEFMCFSFISSQVKWIKLSLYGKQIYHNLPCTLHVQGVGHIPGTACKRRNGPTEARLRVLSITQLRAWAHRRSAYAQLSPLHLLSTLYVTHVIKYSRHCKRRKAGRGLGTRLCSRSSSYILSQLLYTVQKKT